MKMLTQALALVAVAALPLAAERLRPRVERCAMDGVEIRPAFRVRVVEAGGTARTFCGVVCAEAWIGHEGPPAAVFVTAQGREIDAERAWFVGTARNRSEGAPDGIRVFAGREDALRHAEAYGGTLLSGAERPFAGEGGVREDR
jgi:hypothetical protein